MFVSMFACPNLEKQEKITGLERNKVMLFESNWQQLDVGYFIIVENNVIVSSFMHM